MSDSLDSVRDAVRSFVDPFLREPLGAAGIVESVDIGATGAIAVRLVYGFPVGGYESELTPALESWLAARGQAVADRGHAAQRDRRACGAAAFEATARREKCGGSRFWQRRRG